MRHFLFFFSLFFVQYSSAQLKNEVLDYGNLDRASQRYIDLKINNPKKEKIYILRVEHSPEVTYRLSSDLVLPDSSVSLRIQVNPRKKGKFTYVLNLYLSDQTSAPVEFKLTGTLVEEIISSNSMTQCPDFGASPASYSFQPKNITVITIDKTTGKPLAKSQVSIIHNGIPAGTWITGTSGAFKDQFPPGFFYLIAGHEGYLTKEAGVYVNPEISEITIPLTRDPQLAIPVNDEPEKPETEILANEGMKLPDEEAKQVVENQLKNETVVIPVEIPELATIPMENFSDDYFNDVNIEFVLDVSSSMKMGEKMDLLKYSLNQLVSRLRPQDKMGLVTYANTAQVFMSPTAGNQKENIQKAVSDLKPLGMTAGGKGIKMGFKEVMKNYDASKTNMVIVITDGAFNRDSEDYQKVVKKYASKGVIFSVVGIQAKEKDATLMEEAAQFGKGRYIPIQKMADAHSNLVQEIRIASFKKGK